MNEMILYNVTVSIDPSIQEDWTVWMKENHIPEVLSTQCFQKCVFSKIQGKEDEECTFSIMYYANSLMLYNEYQANHAQELQAKHQMRYEGKFVAFRTLLDIIQEMQP
jgi:hypothetical protein